MSFYQDYLKEKSKEKKGLPSDKTEETKEDLNLKEEAEREKFLKRIYGEDEIKNAEPPSIGSDPKAEPPSLSQQAPKESFSDKEDLPPVPPAPPKAQKIWVRILITFLIIAAISALSALLWWYLIKTPRIVIETVTEEVETIVEIPEIGAPLSSLRYAEFRDPIVTRTDEIPVYLRQYVNDDYQSGSLVKISIKNQEDRTNPSFINLTTFFSSLGISAPRNFYEKIKDEDFNLFLYSEDRNDLGFIFPVAEGASNELLGIVLAIWDDTIEKDFRNFYSIVDPKEDLAPSSSVYQRITIRCKSFASGYELCYLPYRNSFIMTTSLRSAQVAIDNFR